MKLQSLAIIFIIIILPISMVFSVYISNKITCAELELEYDTILLNSTYDAVKAYQLNTVNNQFGDITNEKVSDIEAAISTFKNSLSSDLGYSGYNASVIDEYIPAVVFTTYDGYYMYSPFYNTLTNLSDGDYSSSYSVNGEETTGLRPYVTYSCHYVVGDDNDFVITYTLDNYITIEGTLGGHYHYDYGYLYNVATGGSMENTIIHSSGSKAYYYYDGIMFCIKADSIYGSFTEEMKEYVGTTEYSYVKINGTKYYLDPTYYGEENNITATVNGQDINVNISAGIFYIDSNGEKNYSQAKYDSSKGTDDEDNLRFVKYYYAIKYNYSAYEYYKNAYEFSTAVLTGSAVDDNYTDKANNEVKSDYKVLTELTWQDAVIWTESANDTTSLESYASASDGSAKIFTSSIDDPIQCSTSNFNEHRKAIIRYTIETNLVSAINSFSSSKSSNFIMPKISEDDWEIIENDICAITFMQGMSIGTKQYNGYSVVANTLTNDYVDENDIYILAQDTKTGNLIYCKPNDGTISGYDTSSSVEVLKNGWTQSSSRLQGPESYSAGIWKINFEKKQYVEKSDDGKYNTIYYIPISYASSTSSTGMLSYYGSYTSIYGSYNVNAISTGGKYAYFNGSTTRYTSTDMYTYMHYVHLRNPYLGYAYYYGLGRERFGSFNVNNINIELYGNNYVDSYFFKDLTVSIQ